MKLRRPDGRRSHLDVFLIILEMQKQTHLTSMNAEVYRFDAGDISALGSPEFEECPYETCGSPMRAAQPL